MGLHMAVFTVRSLGNVKDGNKNSFMHFKFSDLGLFTAIYYEPSPYFRDRKLPSTLDDLKKPKLQSFTMKFGVASGKNFIEEFLKCKVVFFSICKV